MSRLTDAIFANARDTPRKTAVILDDRALTYGQLRDEVCRMRVLLADRGVHAGTHLGLALGNEVAFVCALLATADAGAAVVPVSPAQDGPTLGRILAQCDAGPVLARRAAAAALAGDTSKGGRDEVVLTDTAGREPTAVRHLGRDGPSPGPANAGREGDPYILTTTSGSTGDPKPIVLGQDTKYERARSAIALYGVDADDVVLAATPLYHSLAMRLLFVPLIAGGTAVILSSFTPQRWIEAVKRHGVTFTIPVSAQLMQVQTALAHGGGAEALASLRRVVSSSAPMPTPAKRELLSRTEFEFHECYGTSELGIVTDLDVRRNPERIHTVGRPIDDADVRILDENDADLPSGQVGEIACHSHMLFHGYYRRPDENRNSFAAGHFKTKDLGHITEDGYLVYKGRKTFTINRGGAVIYPEDIEAVVSEHPGVAACAAFGCPDDRVGEEIALAVVPTAADAVSARALRRHCVWKLADHQHPRHILLVDSLPKNALGKLDRPALVGLCPGSDAR